MPPNTNGSAIVTPDGDIDLTLLGSGSGFSPEADTSEALVMRIAQSTRFADQPPSQLGEQH